MEEKTAQITLTLTASLDDFARVLDAFCVFYGYDAEMEMTQQEFLKAKVLEMVLLPSQKQERATRQKQATIEADAATAQLIVVAEIVPIKEAAAPAGALEAKG